MDKLDQFHLTMMVIIMSLIAMVMISIVGTLAVEVGESVNIGNPMIGTPIPDPLAETTPLDFIPLIFAVGMVGVASLSFYYIFTGGGDEK